MSGPVYDFIIVGGGAAGCVLANRLSADRANRVLVLEAGRPDYWWDVFTHMPAAMGLAIESKHHNWKFVSEPEPHMHARRMAHPRGKLLGGSSSINAMTFVRGHRANFDNWAKATGQQEWDYAHCLPYFKRLENSLAFGDSEYRGGGGPQTLERAALDNPLFGAFFLAAQQAGYDLSLDLNGEQQEGFAAFDRIIRHGKRQSAAGAYLHPVENRRNLEVRCRALVTKVIFSGTRAVGLSYRGSDGVEHQVRGKEIILSGGAFNSPQVLQLSGVGNSDDLSALGIPTVHHLPGVGENLEDHLAVQVQHACTKPISLIGMKSKLTWPSMGVQWLLGRGPATSNIFEAAGFIRSNDDVDFPDVMVGFAAVAMAFDPEHQVQGHGYQVHVGTMAARARGSVKLASADPTVYPKIVINYLDNERDRADWVKAIRLARELLAQPAFRDLDAGEVVPGPAVQTDEEIVDWVARAGQTGLHPTASCRMGHRELDVVDPSTMRVHGLQGLRVVDASVFPSVTNTQTYAPTLMVAEKAADIILGNTPLAPQYTGSTRPLGRIAPPAVPLERVELPAVEA
ncbi:choline dehydrogenase [Pseudonocardia sp. GCM10023141]|uniref:choline dehydrogenase n=1 Tax=Pseudonocardia sp. GCM10023141 TaxID=3252653 RepID=UPI003620E24A